MNRIPLLASASLLLSLSLTALSVTGCKDGCDPDQDFIDNTCHARSPGRPADAGASSGGSPGTLDGGPADAAPADAGSGGSTGADRSAFGKVCTADAACSGVADYCVIQPGTAAGFCSERLKSCGDAAAECPGGWTCLDLSAFSPDLSPVCMKP